MSDDFSEFGEGVSGVDLIECAVAASADVGSGDVDEVAGVLGHLARLRRLVDGRELDCLARLEVLAAADPAINPEHVNATATLRSPRACVRLTRRARAALSLPVFAALVADGEVSGEHLDAFERAVRGLPAALRPALSAQEARFAAGAVGQTVDELTEQLRAEANRLEADDGVGRLERQRRRTGLRQWTDRDGMWCLAGRFDPATGLTLAQLLQHQTEARFHGARPEHCPDDPLAAHDFLQAMALADLITGNGPGVGGAEIIVTIDEDTWLHGRHSRSRVECGHGIDLPIDTIRNLTTLTGRTRFVPVVVDHNGVVIVQGHPVPTFEQLRDSLLRPVCLDAGRTRRYATRHQRRAIRAMYRRCAIPGCDGHVSRTQPHHIDYWEHGGLTDMRLLIPLCPHHHDRLHAEGWELTLGPDRSLTITRDGKLTMSTGPPADQWR